MAQILTILDQAATAMRQGDAGDIGFYQTLAETDLALLLQDEIGTDGTLTPQLFDLPTGKLVLAFDSEDRLADWAAEAGQGALPYARLPGRVIAQQLAGLAQAGMGEVGLGLNFGTGTPSEMILPAEAMGWLAQMLGASPRADMGHIAQVLPLGALPAALIPALQRGLLRAGGLAQRAVLARVTLGSGAQAHILAFFGASAEVEEVLARSVAEALAFSGIEAATLDVIFVPPQSGLAEALLRLGQEIDLPAAPPSQAEAPRAAPLPPGMDPAAPPRLK